MQRLRLVSIFWASWAVSLIAINWLPTPIGNQGLVNHPPSFHHPLGTSPTGVDLTLALLVAILKAQSFAVLATLLACCVALPLGMLTASVGNKFIWLVERNVATIFDSVSPIIVIAVILVVFPSASPAMMSIVLGFLGWTFLIGAVRRNTHDLLTSRHILMLKSIGFPRNRILFASILPEILFRLTPQAAALAAIFVGVMGSVEFLGLGARRSFSLGYMVLDSLDHLGAAPHYFIVTMLGAFIAVFLLSYAASALSLRLKLCSSVRFGAE